MRQNEPSAHPWMANSLADIKQAMLKEIGARSVEELFEQIPSSHRLKRPLRLPRQLSSEAELKRHLVDLLAKNENCEENLNFLGAGCWQHHVPAVVDEIVGRAEFLTPVWGSDQFLPTQLLQAIGQSFALSGIVFFGILHLRPQDALTFGGAVQTARLMGGQIGSAFVTTLVRVRSQTASNHIGLHVQAGAGDVAARLQAYAAAAAPADPAAGAGRAVGILSNVVRGLATTQGVIDTFAVISGLSAVALMLVVAHKAAPLGPASHIPLLGPPKAPAS